MVHMYIGRDIVVAEILVTLPRLIIGPVLKVLI